MLTVETEHVGEEPSDSLWGQSQDGVAAPFSNFPDHLASSLNLLVTY